MMINANTVFKSGDIVKLNRDGVVSVHRGVFVRYSDEPMYCFVMFDAAYPQGNCCKSSEVFLVQ